jgi:hypothetical protein
MTKKRIAIALATVATILGVILGTALPASASNLGKVGTCSGTLYGGSDYSPPGGWESISPNSPLGYTSAWNGGWRALTGAAGTTSVLAVGGILSEAGTSPEQYGDPTDARIEIKTASGHISPGAWQTIPAYPDGDGYYLLSTIAWQNNVGNSWRVQIGRLFIFGAVPSYNAGTWRCSS